MILSREIKLVVDLLVADENKIPRAVGRVWMEDALVFVYISLGLSPLWQDRSY